MLIGNNASCNVMGIGSVRVKIADGIVRTLRNVRHIPDMKKNLISLGALDSNGCRCILEKGVLRVIVGAQMVMKSKNWESLYEFTDSTIKGSACVSSSMKEADHTKLWHLRLRHMSDKGLLEFSKKDLLGS